MTKYLFICVHPDDLEFNCSILINHLVEQGKDVNLLSLTKGEFGIFEEEWKGPRLAKIRSNEFRKSAKLNGINKSNVFLGDIIDGFVRFDRKNINKVINWINKIQPDIIFAPEAYFTYYWHPDHIDCGKISYYIFKNLQNQLKNKIRALYYYTTAKPNFIWPFNDPSHVYKTLFQHQSQWWLLKWSKSFYPFEKHNTNKRKLGNWKYVERYRRVYLNKPEPKPSILLKGILNLLSGLNVINPPDKHFVVPDMNSEFGKEVKKLRLKYNFKD